MKILIVDDDPSIRRFYKEELTDDGYTVLTAASGKEAMDAIDKEKPHLVTVDVLMPSTNRIEVLNKLKEKMPDLPVIVNTAYPQRTVFAVWKPDAYVIKSSDTMELRKIIKKLLLQHQS